MRRMWSKNQLENQSKQAAEEVIESGLVENAKPIYFHPIRFTIFGSSSGQEVCVINGSIMILNNSSSPLDTSEKLMNYLYNQGSAIDILCNVDFYDSQGVYQGQILGITGESTNIKCQFTKNGTTTNYLYLASTEFFVTSDSVNKIN